MVGTILNAVGILVGGTAGMVMARPMPRQTQLTLKFVLGIGAVFVGLKAVWDSMGTGFSHGFKQLIVIVVAMIFGRLAGQLIGLQKWSNALGQMARRNIDMAEQDRRGGSGKGFITCSILFCVGPIAMVGALQDGISGSWQTLAIKSVMDGLAAMAFVGTFGGWVVASVVPVMAYQGGITLGARYLTARVEQGVLVDSVEGVAGMLVFCVGLIILEIKRIELADYLPSLVVAPFIAWLWL